MGKLYSVEHDAIPSGAAYIGRSSPWGNRFKMGRGVSRAMACQLFERETLPKLDLTPLIGRDLICHCVVEPWSVGDTKVILCHGMSILEEIERRHGNGR